MNLSQCSLYILIGILSMTNVADSQEISPCPRIFTYEPKGPEQDRWYGILTLLDDTDLNGVWLRIVFDRPILQLGNWFGEVVKKGPADYLIRNPGFILKARTPKIVRIFVKYKVNQPPPKLVQFRLNARIRCPEGLTTTTTTTTERLFTSLEEDVLHPLAADDSFGATTKAPFDSGLTNSVIVNGNENQPQIEDEDIRRTFPVANVAITQSPSVSVLITPTSGDSQQYQDQSFSGVAQPQQGSTVNLEICGTVAEPYRHYKHIGQVAHKGEFPWHAMLYYSKDITIAYLCGAALISKHYLLTVAHCVIKSKSQMPINPERLIIYLGKYYVKHWQHENSQTAYVEEIMPHPDYNSETYDNDIALLKLLHPTEFSNIVRPICLWKESTDFGLIANRPGTVVGWGFDETGKIEDKLMFVQMFVQNDEVCNRSVGSYFSKLISQKAYCANFIDDTVECVGDSGGAMVFPRATTSRGNTVWQLRGLVTVSVVLQHHLKCGRDRYVVFTDVTTYHDWIKENTKLK